MEARKPAAAAIATSEPAIVRDPKRCGGDPERVRNEALPHLSPEQIHAAIGWYSEHQQEIDEILHRREEDYQRGLARVKAMPFGIAESCTAQNQRVR